MYYTPIFHFATAHATPTRRSIGDRSVEILIAPTSSSSHEAGFAGALISIGHHASHESVNDTTCTTQSDYSNHVCHLHSTEACGESLPPELQVHVQNIAHRTDAPQRIYLVSFSMHGHIFSWYFYLYCISHSRYLLFSHAPHNTARSLMQDSPDKHTASLVCLALLRLHAQLEP